MNENKSGAVPERKDIPDKYKWNLEDIYESIEEWQKSYDSIQERIDALKTYAGRLGEGFRSENGDGIAGTRWHARPEAG